MNIPDRWIALLDMLSDKDLATLMRAILHGEEEPTLAGKNQSVADLIYGDIAKTKYFAEAKRKSRKKFDSQMIVKEMSNDCQRDVKEMSNDCQTNVKQEERKEGVPPCSPLPLSPTPPITNPPIIPPSLTIAYRCAAVCCGRSTEGGYRETGNRTGDRCLKLQGG